MDSAQTAMRLGDFFAQPAGRAAMMPRMMARPGDSPWPAPATSRTAPARLKPADYLQKILTARVYDVAIETPAGRRAHACRAAGQPRAAQARDDQPVFSFKLRGAYNKMAQPGPKRWQRGVICASAATTPRASRWRRAAGRKARDRDAGDHAEDSRWTPCVRPAAVVLVGDDYSDAYLHALELERTRRA